MTKANQAAAQIVDTADAEELLKTAPVQMPQVTLAGAYAAVGEARLQVDILDHVNDLLTAENQKLREALQALVDQVKA